MKKIYPWAYERECRLVVRLSEDALLMAVNDKLNMIRLKIPSSGLIKMKNRIVRSPIYQGGVDYGKSSTLTGDVEWNL